MKTITYKCDRCGEVIEDPSWDAFSVSIVSVLEQQKGYTAYPSRNVVAEAHWCRSCAVACHAIAPESSATPAPNPPTLEEMIRDIVREELED